MKQALIVIDVQKEYFSPDGKLPLPRAEDALQNIKKLLEAARKNGIPVIHVLHENVNPDGPLFRRGSDGVRMHPSIKVLDGERTIIKHVPGSFTGTALEQLLGLIGVDSLIICGFMTQQCCEMTARQAYERSIPVLFASDATASRAFTVGSRAYSADEIQEVSLAVLTQFAQISTTHEISALFEQSAAAISA